MAPAPDLLIPFIRDVEPELLRRARSLGAEDPEQLVNDVLHRFVVAAGDVPQAKWRNYVNRSVRHARISEVRAIAARLPLAPAGWYVDPFAGTDDDQRWFDGEHWSDQVRAGSPRPDGRTGRAGPIHHDQRGRKRPRIRHVGLAALDGRRREPACWSPQDRSDTTPIRVGELEESWRVLSSHERWLLTMHYVDGWTCPEIADLLDVTTGSIAGKVMRALGKLRQRAVA